MNGWVQTLDGADVFDQGDGWIWFPRERGWRFEPGLLTMPKAPMSERVSAEAQRLSTGWPTLRQAWRWQGPYAGGTWDKVLRVWVLVAGVYNAICMPGWVMETLGWYDFGDQGRTWALRGILIGVIAVLCLLWLWVDHVTRRDPHKGALILGAATALLVWRAHERHEQRRLGGHY